ncbi:TadE/TadG family type IV pilus assembly protein [Promicromonospora iranensis]|uniref:Flp pilus assembly protein TadG n=1 Tax=Promicromonospora iranensis TaxID=1105144 RepID=A0ABU2CIT7_9MICO|nr:TadE/TadG family type IV pilus assembly protein [Promicromonospora iranensis]MDR7381232.1 Flp pilus assembly protein TadG [Promicromonospora iranensis]
MTRRRKARSDPPGQSEAGVAAIEVVVMALPVLVVCWAIMFGALYALAHQSVQAAAADAARSASLARTVPAAQAGAHTAATMTLANQDLRCATTDVAADTSGLLAPAGQPSTVSATVTCHLDPIRLGLPIGRPVTISATMSSPVDTWRSQ